MVIRNVATDSGERFASKSAHYARFRPGYPVAIIPFLEQHAGLTAGSQVADIGSGTGLLTQLFLDYGNVVFGVEPNGEMRATAETFLAGHTRFRSVAGKAEATALAACSVDHIVVGQAFHWFDWPAARIEFQRILKPGGYVALIWNALDSGSALVRGYQEVLRDFGGPRGSYAEINHARPAVIEAIEHFFEPAGCLAGEFGHEQLLDSEGLQGRFLSTSTAPLPGDEQFAPALDALATLFSEHVNDGQVRFSYVTRLHVGQLL